MPTVHITATLSDPDVIRRLQERHKNPRDFLEVVAVAQFASMAFRLQESYSLDDEAYRTGTFMASLQVQEHGGGSGDTVFDLRKFEVTVGSSVPYAAMQDEGGTILPKTVKFLAVPLTRAVKVRGLWPRDYAEDALRFVPNRGGGSAVGFLFDASEEGKLGLGTGPLFSLVSSVDIPAKRMADAAIRETQEDLDEMYHDWIEAA